MPIWITSSADRGIRATEGQKAWIAEHTEELSRKQQFDINNDETTFENFYISNVRMFPWCKGCAEEKARDSGAMHRARKSRSGVMRVRPSGTVRFNEKQKMSENNLVRL